MTARVVTRRRSAAVLLEVVIALAILVAALGLLGGQLAGGLEMTSYSEEQLRATQLADQLVTMVQLDPRLAALMQESETLEYECTDETPLGYALAPLPGTFWRIVHEPVDRENEQKLRRVVIEVLRQPSRDRFDSRDAATVVRQLVMFKAAPPRVAEVWELNDVLADWLQSLTGMDPRTATFQDYAATVDPEMLKGLLRWGAGSGPGPGSGPLAGPPASEGEGSSAGPPGDAPGIDSAALARAIREAIEAAGGMPPPAAVPPPAPVRPGGRRPPAPPMEEPFDPSPRGGPPPGIDIGRGSGPGGEYTIEDLMRLRDAYERQQQGGL